MARYELIRGSYTGTSDDVAGRWYLVDRESDIIDKRGPGFATRREALDTLVERLWDDDLVDVSAIAERAGTTPGTVHQWRRRHPGFPAPVVTLAVGPVWRWEDVEAWLAKPRLRTGRPRKA